MSYLLDRQAKRKRYSIIAIFVVVFIILFYFRTGVTKGLSYVGHFVFQPVLLVGNGLEQRIANMAYYFSSKDALLEEKHDLQLELSQMKSQIANYNSILDENSKLKTILERKNQRSDFILGAVLEKPNRSIYDTLIVDIGRSDGVRVGARVFAFGNVAIGTVAETFVNSSKIVLYSSPSEKTDVVISGRNAFVQVVGRGGGNFEIVMPKDFTLDVGAEVSLPGITPHIVAKVEEILSDPRDSVVKALLATPINIFELKFVEIEI